MESPPVVGGFAFKCRVFRTWYTGHAFCSTKKDAKHEAAKCALLGMDIPGLGKCFIYVFCVEVFADPPW